MKGFLKDTKHNVVITGAANGIGCALAKLFEKNGHSVAALDLNPEVKSKFKNAWTVDISNEAAFEKTAYELVEKWGRPTIWINNAGITVLGEFEKVSSAEFSKVMSINFNGVVYGSRIAMSVMQKPKAGMIVNMASISGVVAAPFMTSYTASKHAVVGFTRALREEVIQLGTAYRFILVTPGFIDTQIMKSQNGFEFPQKLKFLVESPEAAAKEIYDGLNSGEEEIVPTKNGKMMAIAHRLLPKITLKSSRVLTAKNFKQLLGLQSSGSKK